MTLSSDSLRTSASSGTSTSAAGSAMLWSVKCFPSASGTSVNFMSSCSRSSVEAAEVERWLQNGGLGRAGDVSAQAQCGCGAEHADMCGTLFTYEIHDKLLTSRTTYHFIRVDYFNHLFDLNHHSIMKYSRLSVCLSVCLSCVDSLTLTLLWCYITLYINPFPVYILTRCLAYCETHCFEKCYINKVYYY